VRACACCSFLSSNATSTGTTGPARSLRILRFPAERLTDADRVRWGKGSTKYQCHAGVLIGQQRSFNLPLTPRNRGKHTTLLASLSFSGIGASIIIEGAVNVVASEAYVEQILAPSLSAGQIVVLDNLSVHKGAQVRQLIEAHGCQLLFLPAYSPDYSPIEETFSKVKAFLRRLGARTHEALQEALAQALETVTAQDALGWFRHCGYLPADGRA